MSLADLEQEGEIAADYIEGLLDVADFDGDIDMDVEGDRAVVSVVGATLDELVGDRGEVLDALQELTRLAVHRQTGARTRLMLDIGGYRAQRRADLSELGANVAEEVKRTGEAKALGVDECLRAEDRPRRRRGRRPAQRVGGHRPEPPSGRSSCRLKVRFRSCRLRRPRPRVNCSARGCHRRRPTLRCLPVAGVERGLIGPAEAGRIWERHLINSGLLAELLPARFLDGRLAGGDRAASAGAASGGVMASGESVVSQPVAGGPVAGGPVPGAPAAGPIAGRVADLGSGAGLPGLVLAILRPDLQVTLVEPMARRTVFLAECVDALGLGNVEIRRGRAEDLAGQLHADVVTSRAVARLERLAVLSAGLCRPGGLVLAIKGASAVAELDQARSVLRRLGGSDAEVVIVGQDLAAGGLIEQPTTVIRFRTALGANRPAKR